MEFFSSPRTFVRCKRAPSCKPRANHKILWSRPVRKGYLSHENVSVRQRTESAAITYFNFGVADDYFRLNEPL